MTVKIQLGQLVATPEALQAIAASGQSAADFLERHRNHDYGDVSAEDRRLNDEAAIMGERILSAYRTLRGVKVWVLTEADRSVTTILLPEQY